MIPLTRPNISKIDINNVSKVLRTGMLVQGSHAVEVEKQFERLLGVEGVSLVSSGTAALHLALLSCSIGPGDEVIVPAFSYVATANVVELVGAKPIFVDISENSFNIDTSALDKNTTANTKAIIPVHEFGYPAKMDAILQFAKDKSIRVIEDAACALGTRVGSSMAGTIGDCGCFSFHPRKSVTSGEGGLFVSKSEEVHKLVRAMRNHGNVADFGLPNFALAGLNYRLTDFQAALLEGQLQRLNYMLEERAAIAQQYLSRISNEGVLLPSIPDHGAHSWQSFHVMFPTTEIRGLFFEYMKENGIQTGVGAQCIPVQTYYRKKYDLRMESFPVAYAAYSRGAVLPLYSGMPQRFVDKIINKVNDFQRKISGRR